MPTAICASPPAIASRTRFEPAEPVSSTQRTSSVGAQRLEREEVLLGQRLGRRHQRSLAPALDRAQERVERDHRLAGADVALQQALHRHRPGEIGVDLLDRALLVLGQRERQRRAVALDQLAGRGRAASRPRRRRASGRRRAAARGARRARGGGALPRPRAAAVGEVDRGDRVAAERQLERRPAAYRGGRARGPRAPPARGRAAASRRNLLARRIDGREVGGRSRLAEVVALHVEAVPAELAAQADWRAGRELLDEPRLVEPRRRDRAALVLDAAVTIVRRPPTRRERTSWTTPAITTSSVAPELRDRQLVRGALVAARRVQQQVGDRARSRARAGASRASARHPAASRRPRRASRELAKPRGRGEAVLRSGPHLRNPRAVGSSSPPAPEYRTGTGGSSRLGSVRPMKALLLTREFPPDVYGGAGVHVEYLARELAKRIDLEVRCFGEPRDAPGVHAFEPVGRARRRQLGAADDVRRPCDWPPIAEGVDVVHSHTWYTIFGGHLAKLLHGVPHVVTTHSLEPMRPWKAEQLGAGGYALSSFCERTGIESADAVSPCRARCAADVQSAYPQVDPSLIEVVYNGIDTDQYQPRPEHGRAASATASTRRADRPLRRPDHAAEGDRAPARRRARDRHRRAARLLRRRARRARDRARDPRARRAGARAAQQRRLDRGDAPEARGDPAAVPRDRVLRAVDLRAARDRQPGGDGLRGAGRRLGRRRHPGGRRRRRDRPARAGRRSAPTATRSTRRGSPPTSPRASTSCSPTRSARGAWARRAACGRSTSSAGARSPSRRSRSTTALIARPRPSSSYQKKPIVPGPACVPTTAPSVVAISILACGRTCSTSSRARAAARAPPRARSRPSGAASRSTSPRTASGTRRTPSRCRARA